MNRTFAAVALLIMLSLMIAGCEMAPPAEPVSVPAAESSPEIEEFDFRWPYNLASDVTFDEADLTEAWERWKKTTLTSANSGGMGRLRVMGGVDKNSSVSEGLAYGMLFATIFDEQDTFDGLWLFVADHLDQYGLMHWHIGDPGQLLGRGAATDAEADMAIALVNACVKVDVGAWSVSPFGVDYCGEATKMINAMWEREVDKPGPDVGLVNNQGYELIPGDTWNVRDSYADGIVNLSYFSPGYFEVFAKFTGNDDWYKVIDRQYELTDVVQAKPGNCSGLVHNWIKYNGDPQLVTWQERAYEWWSYDAARFAWRVAVDQQWYGRAEANETMTEVGSFFANAGFGLLGEHSMDGDIARGGAYPFFIANAAAAIYAAPELNEVDCGMAGGRVREDKQSAYETTLAKPHSPPEYYNDAWRLFSMLLMTGNFPNFYETALSNK